MRGKAISRSRPAPRPRIIPAGAGKRILRLRAAGPARDHPRGCGEKLLRLEVARHEEGSSPRVRGKEPIERISVTATRIIPAGAGKSRRGRSQSACASGSSPRVRGKAVVASRGVWWPGIIPAGAGKSPSLRRSGSKRSNHPRGCGEKSAVSWRSTAPTGSSPRVRGKEGGAVGRWSAWGIIPAGAGKSAGWSPWVACGRDHPRGCGEKSPPFVERHPGTGSSPRVRGKGHGQRQADGRGGIIPAGAGKSGDALIGHFDLRDHPRGCGEK